MSIERWRCVELVSFLDEVVQLLMKSPAPALETLKVKCDSSEPTKMELLSTPTLRTVSLEIWGHLEQIAPQLSLCWRSTAHASAL
ncbi:hypothetical protein C8R43DRAFT_1235154 [Mycena crocata]|nr:hypothetical protein C8R43DRAFT_1235154 [Mycena crocata]